MIGFFNHSDTIIKIKDEISMRNHFHYDVELLYVIEGTYRVITKEETYDMQPGDIFISFPFEEHAYERIGDNLTMIAIFSPNSFENLTKDFLQYRPKEPFLSISDCSPLYGETLRRIGELAMANGAFGVDNDDHISNKAYNLCSPSKSLVMSYFRASMIELLEQLKLIPVDISKRDTIGKILCYCASHITDPNLSIRTLSENIGFSPSYVASVLSKKMNFNFTSIVHKMRVELARNLLISTTKICKEIAFECGFSSQRDFNRIFLEEVGMTPLNFRANVWSGKITNADEINI